MYMNIVIILGDKLKNNGEISSILKQRLNKFLEIKNLKKTKIIVSGGKTQQKALHTEAYMMKKYLIDVGNIAKTDIICENKSKDTIDNAMETLKIVEKINNIKSIIIITSKFHIKRTKHIFNYYYESYKNKIKYIYSKNGLNKDQTKIKTNKEKKYLNVFYNTIN